MMATFRLTTSHNIVQRCAKNHILFLHSHIPQIINLAWTWGCTTGKSLHCPQPASHAGSSHRSEGVEHFSLPLHQTVNLLSTWDLSLAWKRNMPPGVSHTPNNISYLLGQMETEICFASQLQIFLLGSRRLQHKSLCQLTFNQFLLQEKRQKDPLSTVTRSSQAKARTHQVGGISTFIFLSYRT